MSKSYSEEPLRDVALERALPSSPEIERGSIGAVILDNGLMPQLMELFVDGYFFMPANLKIFQTMVTLFMVGSEISWMMIAEYLNKHGELDTVGGVLYLRNLETVPRVSSLESYAQILRSKYILREVNRAGLKMAAEALDESGEAQSVLEHAEKAIFDIAVEHTKKSFSPIGYITQKSLQKAYEVQQSGKALTGVTSGFKDIDSLTLGWQPGDLIVIAGRPGTGKTSMALDVAKNAAKTGHRVAFFSLEMPDEQIAMRALCSEARVDSTKYQSGYILEEEWQRLEDAHRILVEAPLLVDDTPAISVLQLKAKAMRFIATHGELHEIVVDYIGLMSGSDSRYENRQVEVSKISGGLKALAKELRVPLIMLSQLNRSPENRSDHRPQLADLRESGSIEQDADVVAFLYRADMYRPRTEPRDNLAEFIIAKNRNGRCDTALLRFDDYCTRFDSLDRHRYSSGESELPLSNR